MEKKNKKLQLNRETIRNLSDENLEQVAGGKRKGDTDGLVCVSFVNKTACINVGGCQSKNTCVVCSNFSCAC
jgi:hypothetical protein